MLELAAALGFHSEYTSGSTARIRLDLSSA
jgi:hypothetical protein